MENHLFVCSCSDINHQVILHISKDFDWDEDELYISVHLNKLSFLKRLKYSILYLLGYKCKYGAFQEICLKKEDAIKLTNLIYEKL